jgi:hypothetical protein
VRARVEYRGALERGDVVDLASVIGVDGEHEELAVWLSVDGDVRVSATVTLAGPGGTG